MLKILQAKLQQYLNQELPDVQAVFRKGKRTRDQIANIHCILEKARELQKNIYFCFIDYAKAFDCLDHSNLWKILKELEIPHHLTWPASWEICMQVRKQQLELDMEKTDWLQIGKRVHQVCILSPCLFNLYAEYIMRTLGWRKHKLESRLLGEISVTSDMQMIPPLWQKVKN